MFSHREPCPAGRWKKCIIRQRMSRFSNGVILSISPSYNLQPFRYICCLFVCYRFAAALCSQFKFPGRAKLFNLLVFKTSLQPSGPWRTTPLRNSNSNPIQFPVSASSLFHKTLHEIKTFTTPRKISDPASVLFLFFFMHPDTCANSGLNVLKEWCLFSVPTHLSLGYIQDKFPFYCWATCIDKQAFTLTPTAN